MRLLRWKTGLVALATGAALAATPAASAQSERVTVDWQITVANMTPPGPGAPGSQPMSPPVVVIHSSRADVWTVGQLASHGVAAVAEDANNQVLVDALEKVPGVRAVFIAADGPIPSGESAEFSARVRPGERVSIVTMLVNTNDAFTGVDAVFPHGTSFDIETVAYDAGSEVNTERMSDIPGPCCNNPFVRVPEGDVIRPHEGITGRGDLDPDLYGWSEPVAEISFERVR